MPGDPLGAPQGCQYRPARGAKTEEAAGEIRRPLSLVFWLARRKWPSVPGLGRSAGTKARSLASGSWPVLGQRLTHGAPPRPDPLPRSPPQARRFREPLRAGLGDSPASISFPLEVRASWWPPAALPPLAPRRGSCSHVASNPNLRRALRARLFYRFLHCHLTLLPRS